MCGKTEDIFVTWATRYLVTGYDIWLWQDPKLWCCRGRNDKSFCGSNDHHDEQCVLKVLVQSGKKHYCVCVLGTVGKVERGGRRNWSIKIETSPVDSSIHQFIIHRENEILQITPEGFLFVLIKSTHWKYTQSSYCWLKKSFWSSAHLPAWDLSTSILWLLGSSGSQNGCRIISIVPYSNVSTNSDMKSGFLLPFFSSQKVPGCQSKCEQVCRITLKRNTIWRGENWPPENCKTFLQWLCWLLENGLSLDLSSQFKFYLLSECCSCCWCREINPKRKKRRCPSRHIGCCWKLSSWIKLYNTQIFRFNPKLSFESSSKSLISYQGWKPCSRQEEATAIMFTDIQSLAT